MSVASGSLLDELRKHTKVDCDTLDPSVPQRLGSFEDCTSNQAIALGELSKEHNQAILKDAAHRTIQVEGTFPNVAPESLAVEFAMVMLGLRMLPFITGCMHLQVNPVDASNESRLLDGAKRLVAIAKLLQADVDTSRLVIKVPSTWEGLQACRKLENAGIKTLATTLFAFSEAVAAAEAGCHYIAPYLHDLRYVTRWPNFQEAQTSTRAIQMSIQVQEYYKKHGSQTQVIPAALMTVEECFLLKDITRMTVSPTLLEKLANQAATSFKPSDAASTESRNGTDLPKKASYIDDREAFVSDEERSEGGVVPTRQAAAIDEFIHGLNTLEKMMRTQLDAIRT